MPDDGLSQLPARERLAVVEALLGKLSEDVRELTVAVKALTSRADRAAGQARALGRLQYLALTFLGGSVGAACTAVLDYFRHTHPPPRRIAQGPRHRAGGLFAVRAAGISSRSAVIPRFLSDVRRDTGDLKMLHDVVQGLAKVVQFGLLLANRALQSGYPPNSFVHFIHWTIRAWTNRQCQAAPAFADASMRPLPQPRNAAATREPSALDAVHWPARIRNRTPPSVAGQPA